VAERGSDTSVFYYRKEKHIADYGIGRIASLSRYQRKEC